MSAAFVRVIVMRTVFAFGMLLSSIVICLHPYAAADAPPETAFGEYRGYGCPPKEQIDTCLPTGAADRVHILPGKDAAAMVKVRTVFDKGHTCTLEGGAAWAEDHFTLRADGLDLNEPCQLELRLTGSELSLKDPGARCQQVYCGTRGAFDGAHFKKKR